MLTKAFKKSHPETPWKVVQGMRHVLVHDYATIDTKELYYTAVNDMIPLSQQVKRYLSETDWEAWESVPDSFDEGNAADFENNVKTARRMKAKGYSVQEIAEIVDLPIETIEKL
jgi:hypothetical protein